MLIIECSLYALVVLTTKVNIGVLDNRWKKEIGDMGTHNSGLGFRYLKSVKIMSCSLQSIFVENSKPLFQCFCCQFRQYFVGVGALCPWGS